MSTAPRSYLDRTGGMTYFPRMLDKIRLHAAGQLREDCHAMLGRSFGGDGLCCNFLRIDYDELKKRVLEGGTDEEIFEWCQEKGRRLNKGDLTIWNAFVQKLGWKDHATATLEKWKSESGHADRRDLLTIPDYTDVDEGRKP
jgi:hypothetical protein